MFDQIDCIIIGAGAVEPAIARRLAQEGVPVTVLEAEESICAHTSASENSSEQRGASAK